MTTEIAKVEGQQLVFSKEEKELILKTFGPGLTQLEFDLFCYTAQSVGLNPLKRQIYAIKRKQWNPETKGYDERMTIQTGIDGFRAVSFSNGRTLPGPEPTYVYRGSGATASNPADLTSATAYLKVWGQDGQYHTVSATAYWDEYVPLKKDGTPQAMWAKMPRTMLAKCAEALLHRKCNPEKLSGIYTNDEMQQADSAKKEYVYEPEVTEASLPGKVTNAEVTEITHTTTAVEVDLPDGEYKADLKELEQQIDLDIKKYQDAIPGAKVKTVQKKGKFGFLDEVRKMKAELKALTGSDETYYNILGCIGPGSYEHANEINDRTEQIAFWKGLKTAIGESK